jgi:recombination protein RecA
MIWVGIRAGVDLIIVDSVAAMVPAAEMDKKVEDNAKIGAVAKKLSELLPKVVIWLKGRNIEGEDGSTKTEEGKTALLLINQTRALISTGGHSAETESTSGGKALKFFLSVRLKMTRIRSDFVERKDELTLKKKKIPYGNLVQVKVVKNKLDARQGQTGEVFIRYGFGIDDYHSIIESAAARRIVKKEGSMYTYENLKFRGKDAFRAHLLSEPKTFEALRSKVVDAMLSTSVVVTGDVDEDDIVSGDEDSILDGAEEALGGLEETVESEES